MLSDLALKTVVVFIVVFGAFFIWYTSDQGAEVKEEFQANVLGTVPADFFTMAQESGLTTRTYCPYINPYMSQLFSAGSLEVGAGNDMHKVLTNVTGSDCSGQVSAIFNYDTGRYDLKCSGTTVMSVTIEELSEEMNTYVAETGQMGSLKETIPIWQCFVFFGVLPFVAMFLFLKDILGFTMLSQKVKMLVAIFASALAIMTGVFSEFIWDLAHIASLSVQATFIVVMLVLAFSSVIMSWIGSVNAARAEAQHEAAQMASNLAQKYTFAELSDMFGKKKP